MWATIIGDYKNEGKSLAISIAMEFVETTPNTNKTQYLASNYGTFRVLVNSENFIPQNGPSTQVIDVRSFV